MLSQVVGVKAQPVVGLDQLQTLGDLPDMRPARVVVMVDDPEAHALNLTPRSSRRQARWERFRKGWFAMAKVPVFGSDCDAAVLELSPGGPGRPGRRRRQAAPGPWLQAWSSRGWRGFLPLPG